LGGGSRDGCRAWSTVLGIDGLFKIEIRKEGDTLLVVVVASVIRVLLKVDVLGLQRLLHVLHAPEGQEAVVVDPNAVQAIDSQLDQVLERRYDELESERAAIAAVVSLAHQASMVVNLASLAWEILILVDGSCLNEVGDREAYEIGKELG